MIFYHCHILQTNNYDSCNVSMTHIVIATIIFSVTRCLAASQTVSLHHKLRQNLSHYVTSCLTTSRAVSLRHNLSHYVTSCLTTSQAFSLRQEISHYVTSCLATSQAVSHNVTSCLATSHAISLRHERLSVAATKKDLCHTTPSLHTCSTSTKLGSR